MTTYISVNRHRIRSGEPPVRVARTKSAKADYFRSVKIEGPSELISSPDKPILKCGARLVIITEANVVGTE